MDDFWYDISQLWVGTFFYGIYLVLFCICIYILLHRPRNLGNAILLVTAIALFVFATVQAVFNLVLGAADIDDIDIPYDQFIVATDVIYAVNNVIADGLVIYRSYLVWNNNVKVLILPMMMLVATTVLGLVAAIDFNVLTSYPFFVLSLATNVLVTILTVGRIWWISLQSRAYLKTEEQRRYLSAMAILIESGMLYSATVLTYLIVISIPSISILKGPVFQALIQVMGIAPTLIIVRAGLGVKGNENPMRDGARSQKRPILRARIGQPNLSKDVPAIPQDVVKGRPDYGSGKPWSF